MGLGIDLRGFLIRFTNETWLKRYAWDAQMAQHIDWNAHAKLIMTEALAAFTIGSSSNLPQEDMPLPLSRSALCNLVTMTDHDYWLLMSGKLPHELWCQRAVAEDTEQNTINAVLTLLGMWHAPLTRYLRYARLDRRALCAARPLLASPIPQNPRHESDREWECDSRQ